MKINEEHITAIEEDAKTSQENIDPKFKESINMIFWLCKLQVPFYD